jgi:Ca-activated chloride channel family protein
MLRCSLSLILLAAATLASAQILENPDYKVTVDVELVQLPVSVLDKHGLPVRGLQQEHFSVYEDKIPQRISLFTQEDIPLSVGLVIDVSGSMLEKLDRLNTAVTTFIGESNPQDETFLVTFEDEVFLESDFTGDPRDFIRSLVGTPSSRGTALYDAVFVTSKYLKRSASQAKKVLLVVSDGEDNKSKYNLAQARQAVGEDKIIVYTIGLLSSDSSVYGMQDTGKTALKQLAEGTGGASFFPQKISEVEDVCRKIARDLRNQYTIGYRPSNQNLDGTWRKVVVRINPPKTMPHLKVRTKQGYYAPTTRNQQAQESMK